MKVVLTMRSVNLFAAVALMFAVVMPASAALGWPGQTPAKGVVQKIDYLHHAITVNGQTYAVASNAGFKGIGGFSVLHIGMPIIYTLSEPSTNTLADSPASNAPAKAQPVITHITWLPGGA